MIMRVLVHLMYLSVAVSMLNPAEAAEGATPNAADGTTLRAELARLFHAGKRKEAAELIEDWLRLHPLDEPMYLQLGQLYADQRDSARAVATWQRLLQRVPGREDLYRTVSNRCRRLGLDEPALAVLINGRTQLGEGAFGWEIAQIYMDTDRYEAGVQSMFEHLRTKPGHRHLVQGYLRSKLATSGEAASARLLESLAEAVRSSISSGGKSKGLGALAVSQMAAAVAVQTGHLDAARGIIDMIRDLPGAPTAIYQLAALAEAEGYQEEAFSIYAMLLEHYPDSNPQHARAQLKQGEMMASRGQPELAETVYLLVAQGASGRPEGAQALLQAAQLQLESRNDPRAAAATLARLFGRYKQGSWLLPALALDAECALRLDDLEAYAVRLRERRERSPDDSDVRFDIARLAFFRADFGDAIVLLDSLVRADPGSDVANDALQLLLLIEDHQSEHRALSTLARAQLLERQRRREEANSAWKWLSANASAELGERSLLAHAQLLEEESQDAALELYDRMLTSFPKGRLVLPANLGRARMLEQKGHDREALKAYETTLLQFPTDPAAPRVRLDIQRLRRALRPARKGGAQG
jgi:tetratricopeptide (TPR) repeat protein